MKFLSQVQKYSSSLLFRASCCLALVIASAASTLAQGPVLPAGGYTPEELTTVGGLAATRWGTFLAVGLLFMIAIGIVKKGVGMLIGIFGARRAKV
jgi:hypothetical protein